MAISRNDKMAQKHEGNVCGIISVSGGVPAVSGLRSQNSGDSNVSVADGAAGIHVVTITEFRGVEGEVNIMATPTTADTVVYHDGGTYTNDSLAITFTVRTVAASPAASDTGFHFSVECW